MSEPEYVSRLEKENIAVLVGPNSGGLISIDFDDDNAYVEFAAINREVCQTTKSYGGRGLNIWLRIRGDYPDSVSRLINGKNENVGEWRGGRGITIVDGTHTSGCEYRIDSEFPVKIVTFDDLKWQESWQEYPGRVDPYTVLVGRFGPPFHEGGSGGVSLNESFIAGWIECENDIVFASEFQKFFQYSPEEGIWHPLLSQQVDAIISFYLSRLAKESGKSMLHFKKRKTVLVSIRSQLESQALRCILRAGRQRDWHAVSVANTVIVVTEPTSMMKSSVFPMEFSQSFLHLGKSDINYEEGAECPRFLNELLSPVLDPDDIALLQMVFGLILVTRNDLQKILLLEGAGNLGKGVVTRILDSVVGRNQVTELRTQNLLSRFELSRFRGMQLLAGRDVQFDFLRRPGAAILKALTGGDLLNTELKNVNEAGSLVGDFHVVITSNSPLLLRVDEDSTAWERRLLIIPFHAPSGDLPKRIRNFEQILLSEEGPGILNWVLQGAQRALQEIFEHGTILLTPLQRARIENRVKESDTIGFFVDEGLVFSSKSSISSEQLLEAYQNFCSDKSIVCERDRAFQMNVKYHIERRFGSKVRPSENTTCSQNSARRRGYFGIALANA